MHQTHLNFRTAKKKTFQTGLKKRKALDRNQTLSVTISPGADSLNRCQRSLFPFPLVFPFASSVSSNS